MEEKITLAQAVIVEGKYDKIRLSPLLDALILTTDGFRVFRDKEMCALIRRLAHSCGIILLTDSDGAGFQIRNYLTKIARGGEITHVYIPDVPGKERRKPQPGKEGKLGVEGIDPALLREAFARAGLLGHVPKEGPGITRQDLYDWGLTGGADSRALRYALLARLGLPARLSTGALLPVLNQVITREEFLSLAGSLGQAAKQE